MLNHITIMGRLTRDPELRQTQSQASVARFTLAVDRDFGGRDGSEKQTDFLTCVAWRQTAEFVSKYFQKGSMAVVSGRLQINSWTDRDGNKRETPEIVVDNIYFGESRRSQSEGSGNTYGSQSFNRAPKSENFPEPAAERGFKEYEDDGDLPF